MTFTANGININYDKFEGTAIGDPLLILHGWGASIETMRGIFNFIKSLNRTVYMLDFPGFGKSSIPTPDWGIYEYATCVKVFMSELEINKPIIIGHSFGGRVGIILASEGLPSKLILVDSAGVKPKFSFNKSLKIFGYKFKKIFGLKRDDCGSADYKALPLEMRSVFVKVVNTHLNKLLEKIKIPTLIIWGESDGETPMYMAKKLNKKIEDSGLAVLKNCGHYCFAESYGSFCLIVKAFI